VEYAPTRVTEGKRKALIIIGHVAVRAGGHGRVCALAENVCEKCAGRICANETAFLDPGGEKPPVLKECRLELAH